MRKTHLICGALIPLMIGAIAPAMADGGDKGKHKNAMFERLDTNKDGLVTEVEFIAHAEAKFAKIDADGNGSFTKEEAKTAHKDMREKRKEKRGPKKDVND